MTKGQAVSILSYDGLRLHAALRGPQNSSLLPLLCLPGLTRNSKDFEPLFRWLPGNRLMIAPDYRGRGQSDYAPEWNTYTPAQELDDALALLDFLGIKQVIVVGTSRGGILAMLMAKQFGSRLRGAILNDIGPKIERDGLVRIASSMSKVRTFSSWPEAIDALKRASVGFSSLSEVEWEALAKRVFIEDSGTIRADFDPNLAKTLPSPAAISELGIPETWEYFAALSQIPCGVLRGEHSDLLSPETVARMKEIHESLVAAEVPDRGHAPFLDEPECRRVIGSVLSQCDNV